MVRSVSVKVIANIREYTAGMQQMAKSTKQFRDEIAETAAKGKGDLDAVANGAIAMGAALIGAFVGVAMAGADFEHQMAQVNAVSGATAAEFDAMRQAALDMGSTTSFSATEAAQATEELAKAGLSAAQITGGALSASLNLAAAGGIGLAESAEIASKSMNQFQLEASDLTGVADTLASSANASNTDVTGLGQSLKNVGTVANQAGFSIEETVGILSAFGDNALVGVEAGTNLKTTLLRLLAPTQEAKNEMERLGIAVFDANGNAKSATAIVAELERGLAGLTQQERAAALSILFGQEAIQGANILLKEGSAGIGEYIDKVSEQGVAAETAGKRLDSLKGDVTLLTSALEGMAIQSSGGATEGLRVLTRAATELVGNLNNIPAPVLATVTVLGAVVGAGLLFTGMAIRVRDKAAEMNQQLRDTGPAGAKAATAISRVGRIAGRTVAVLGGIQAASALLSATLGTQLNPQIEAAAVGLEKWADEGEAAGEIARIMGDDMDKLGQSLKSAADTGGTRFTAALVEGLIPASQEFDDSLANSTERIQAMDSALSQLHGSNPQAAADAFTLIAEEADRQGVSMERLQEIFPEYQAALETATTKTEEATEVVKPYAAELDLLASTFGLTGESAEQAVTDMLQAWSDGASAFIDLVGAYQDGMADLEEDQELTTESFIENLRKQAEAQAEWADNLRSLAERGVGDMINELAAMGPEGAEMVALMASMTDAELQEVVELWGLRGAETGQELAAGILEGTSSSVDGLTNLQDVIDSLHGKNITITTTQVNKIITQQFGDKASLLVERWGGVTHHAQTGLLREAQVFSPVSPARFAFAEPETQGEAFIPKVGNRARSLKILSEAASWYGADVVPVGQQWRGARPMTVSTPDAADGQSPRGRRFGTTVVERQELNVYAHNGDFSYRQVMDDAAYHGAS